jgi:hypothetical protein
MNVVEAREVGGMLPQGVEPSVKADADLAGDLTSLAGA